MSRAAHRPAELLGHAFRGRDVIAAGVLTKEQLRHRAWVRLLHGIYADRDHVTDTNVRAEALSLAVGPRDVVCGRTAAWLHGVWQPRPGEPVPLEISRPPRSRGDEVLGQTRRRLTLRADPTRASCSFAEGDRDVVAAGGFLVTSPLRTCFDLMRERRLVEAVVVADAFLHHGVIDPVSLAVYCEDRYRWPGVRRARLAVSLSSPFARSPGESRLRMVLVLAGFPAPFVNVPILDGSGAHIATPDLQVKGPRWAWLEYDGAYHEEPDQHAADLRRENRLAVGSGGVPILRYDRRHLLGPGRELVMGDVARATGWTRLAELNHGDFARPALPRAW